MWHIEDITKVELSMVKNSEHVMAAMAATFTGTVEELVSNPLVVLIAGVTDVDD